MSMCIEAQNDPVLLQIHKKNIYRSEFEYALNKHGLQGENVSDVLNDFINRKLLSEAAKEYGIDTTANFRNIFNYYKAKQTSRATDDNIIHKSEGQKAGNKLWVSQIFIALPQDASSHYQYKVQSRMDSIYSIARSGLSLKKISGDFANNRMPAKYSNYELPSRNKTFKEVEKVLFDMKEGETSKPFLSPAGYYILRIEASNPSRSVSERETYNPLLLSEYEDGILVQEYMRTIQKKTEEQYQKELFDYFNSHTNDYVLNKPYFDGLLIQCKTKDLTKKLKRRLKKVAAEERMSFIESHCNSDSIKVVRAEKGPFIEGANPIVDKLVFKGAAYKADVKFPFAAVIGKKKKKKQYAYSEVKTQVELDYQERNEKKMLSELRQKYNVQINKSVLQTVNKH